MRLLTLGRVSRLHDFLAVAAVPRRGARVLEIGAGTGALTERLVARGASILALDQNPEMLEQARQRLARAQPGTVELLERTASEIDSLEAEGFDAVVLSLCLSEMSRPERAFVLRASAERLRPGGILAAGDEAVPRGPVARLLHAVLRGPQAALAWLLAGSTSRPLLDLPGEVEAAGLDVQEVRTWLAGRLLAVVARRPGG